MKLVLDTANIEKVKEYIEYLPVEGVTTNPSILKKEGGVEPIQHLKRLQEIIGRDKDLHVQVIANDYQGILDDAHRIVENINDRVCVKVPVTNDGLKAIKRLTREGIRITATAIYTDMQALLAAEMGAEFLAPYINRMENLGIDPYETIYWLNGQLERSGLGTKILAASFKNVSQVTKTLSAGAEWVTLGEGVVDKLLGHANVQEAVRDFSKDWEDVYGRQIF